MHHTTIRMHPILKINQKNWEVEWLSIFTVNERRLLHAFIHRTSNLIHRPSQQFPLQIPPFSTCIHPPNVRAGCVPHQDTTTWLTFAYCALLLDKSIQSKIYNISSLWLMLSSKATLFSVSPASNENKITSALLLFKSVYLYISSASLAPPPLFLMQEGMSVICIAI